MHTELQINISEPLPMTFVAATHLAEQLELLASTLN
jgi:hypothetical protein